MKPSFANFVRTKRIEAKLTLREFCRASGYDPSNWSKIERGIMSPPQSKTPLIMIAKILNLEEGSEEYQELIDLAAISSIPEDLVESELLDQLPIFFRTVRGTKPTKEDLEKLFTRIKSAWTPEK